MIELYCPGIASSAQTIPSVIVGCGHSYQSLIAGILAIIAALVAALPVWRQLKETKIQTSISQRETLSLRLTETIDRFERVKEEMNKTMQILMRATFGPDGDPMEINDHDAHGLHLTVAGKLNWYLENLRDTEAHEIEIAKAKLIRARKQLEKTLDAAYWPAANGRSGEDYSLSDEEWRDVQEKAKRAKVQAADKASAFAGAWRELRDVQTDWVGKTRKRIAVLDAAISAS